MKKHLQRFRIFFTSAALIEILLIAVFGVFYYLNLFDIQSYIDVPLIFIILASIIIIDLVFTFTASIIFSKLRRNSDLKAADLIGGDIQEAYNFGMIGLVIVDENNRVVWVNDLFKDRQIDIIDEDIYSWQPRLQEFSSLSVDGVIKLEINSHNYDVKYLPDAGLYIFRDRTEYETNFSLLKAQAIVIGIIMIDNYSDVSGTADDSNDVISKVRNAIFEYAKKYNVLLKRYRNDAYFVVCQYQSLQAMEKDKFSLLETVHKIGEKQDNPPTLSIGFAHNFADVVKLSEMAENSIDIAMSRGGDQVVVSKYGEDLKFYGGKFDAQENRNKVKVRILADSVVSLIKSSSNVFITGHNMMDMDALGSCLGLKAICDYCKKDSFVIYDPKSVESKTRGAILTTFSREDADKIFISPNNALSKVEPNTLLILSDVHNSAHIPCIEVAKKCAKIMIIDHHRRNAAKDTVIDSPVFTYIEPSAASACELVAELIKYSSTNPRIQLPQSYATIMLSGIFLDTGFFKVKGVGMRAFEASMILKEYGADNAVADDFLKDEYEEYDLITKIVSTIKTPFYGIRYCVADENEIVDKATIAKAANRCLELKGVNAAFAIGRISSDTVAISARSDSTINVQLIMEKLDNGGGHLIAAGTAMKNVSISVAVDRLLLVLEENLNKARVVKE